MVKVNTAKAKHVVLPPGETEVAISSSTTEEGAYYLTVAIAYGEGDYIAVCSCKGFRFQSKCWHIDELTNDQRYNDGIVDSLDVQTLLDEAPAAQPTDEEE